MQVAYMRHTKAAGYQWDAGEEEAAAADPDDGEAQLARWVEGDLFLLEPAVAEDGSLQAHTCNLPLLCLTHECLKMFVSRCLSQDIFSRYCLKMFVSRY